MRLKNKVIIITGAAGRIGSATAEMLLKKDATVILADNNILRLNDLYQNLLNNNNGRVYKFECDITSEKSIIDLIKFAKKNSVKIDSAVHCAYPISEGWGTKFEDLKSEFLFQDLSCQLGSAILFSQRILEYFKNEGGGDLIHISSIQGLQAPKFEHYEGTQMYSPIEYSAIKSGIISITKWLAKYYSNKSIRVNCVSPGGIQDSQPEVFLKKYRQSCTNLGMLKSEQIASCICFLLSSEATAINGQNLIVDDGWTL